MNGKPKVSVVIVNWNGAEHLRLCLPSLASQSFKSLEVIVVDNCSSDESAEVAKSLGVRWLPLEKNLGLAPALNRGAMSAGGDLLLFVNNDMRFDPGFVAALVEPLERDKEIAGGLVRFQPECLYVESWYPQYAQLVVSTLQFRPPLDFLSQLKELQDFRRARYTGHLSGRISRVTSARLL